MPTVTTVVYYTCLEVCLSGGGNSGYTGFGPSPAKTGGKFRRRLLNLELFLCLNICLYYIAFYSYCSVYLSHHLSDSICFQINYPLEIEIGIWIATQVPTWPSIFILGRNKMWWWVGKITGPALFDKLHGSLTDCNTEGRDRWRNSFTVLLTTISFTLISATCSFSGCQSVTDKPVKGLINSYL